MHATDDLGDALAATRAFLLPVDRRRWLKLAFVTLFLGGVGGNVSVQTPPGGGGGGAGGELPPVSDVPDEAWLIAAGVVGAFLVLAVAFAVVKAVMDFVLVQSLREERVEIRRFWSAHWRQGLRLFAFRLAVSLVALVVVGVPVALVVGSLLFDGAIPVLFVGLLLLLPVLLVVPVGAALAKGLTTAFVVPIMILEGGGVLDGWRRFWPTLRAAWKEYLGYVLVNFVLVLVAGIALAVGTLTGAVLLAIPFGVLFAAGFALGTVSEPAGLAAMAVVALGYALAVVVVAALVKAPLVTYLRYYALFVLGDTDPDVDPIPERRRLVRAADDDAAGGSPGGDA